LNFPPANPEPNEALLEENDILLPIPLENAAAQGHQYEDDDVGGIDALIHDEAVKMELAQGIIEVSDPIVHDDSLSVASDLVSSTGTDLPDLNALPDLIAHVPSPVALCHLRLMKMN
jgi:hypothetical protein